tara:strand:+ start:2262 stop:2453 length:192 start_codon:yes stop_codon:yes gene_type:complete
MKRNSTQLDLLNQYSQIKRRRSEKNIEKNLKVKESSVQNILAYSKSVKFIKTTSLGTVLFLKN